MISNYKYIFKRIATIERKYNKDVFEFGLIDNGNEYIELFKQFPNRKSTIHSVRTKLVKYIDYFIPTKIQVNFLKAMDSNLLLDKLKADDELFVFNKNQLDQYKREIIKLDNGSLHLAMFLCPYYGIKGDRYKEIIELKKSDIDEKNGVVRLYNNRTVKINLDFQLALIQAYNTNKTPNGIPLNLYKYPDQIFKFFAKENVNTPYEDRVTNNITTFFCRKIKSVTNEPRLNITSIYRSGMINYVYGRAIEEKINLKEDLINNDNTHTTLYNKFLAEFGSVMDYSDFKYNFGNWIIENM